MSREELDRIAAFTLPSGVAEGEAVMFLEKPYIVFARALADSNMRPRHNYL